MATKQEIEKELKIALDEIGEIIPWFDKRFNEWIYANDLYPVECSGKNPKEVVKRYALYLKEFIKHRLDGSLAVFMEEKTRGHGGARAGAGRPKGTIKEPKARAYLPIDIVDWLKDNTHILQVRELMSKSNYKNA